MHTSVRSTIRGFQTRTHKKGFTLIELLVVIAIIALLISLLLPALGRWRCGGRQLVCSVALKQFGTATHTYAADFQDKIYSFSWTAGSTPSGEIIGSDMLTGITDDLAAGAHQAVNIIRKRWGEDTFPIPSLWIPHVLYSHLVLQDYLDQRLPAKMVVCPEDRFRLQWQDVQNFRSNAFQPFQEDAADQNNWRWSFSSSYQMVPATYSPDAGDTVRQAGQNYRSYQGPTNTGVLGKRKITDVRNFSQKVQMLDSQARHCSLNKRETHYTFPISKQPLLMFDQSVNNYVANRSTLGGVPPTAGSTTWIAQTLDYAANRSEWEAPDDGMQPTQRYARYQWTYGGLKGLDFNTTKEDAPIILSQQVDALYRTRPPF